MKRVYFALAVLEIALLFYFAYVKCKDFLFGRMSVGIFAMVNISLIMVRVFIVDSTVTPKNDPGITIYWMCCLKFG